MSLEYNLQFFAQDGPGGEKTEEPTTKKLDDSRKEGQVAKSKEIGNAFGLIALFLVLRYGVEFMATRFRIVFQMIYSRFPELVKNHYGEVPVGDIMELLGEVLLNMLLILAPIFVIGFAVALVADILQVKWVISSKPLKPKFDKLNPLKGLKRLFSMEKVAELVKSVLKIGLISYVVYSSIQDKWQDLFLLYNMPLVQAILFIGDTVIGIGLKISLIYLVIAAGDFAYQKFKFKKDMRMTKQEIKDEYKNAEGDPAVKGKQKQKMREVSQRRMMQALPKADVVITNPTHYAVAIKYDAELSEAPIVVAKGEDFLAQKIKAVAKEHKVEIIENKPLARMLYHNVEIGGQVPPELYQAVAEVLAMVYQMQGKL